MKSFRIFILVVIFITSAIQPASAEYMPSTDKWIDVVADYEGAVMGLKEDGSLWAWGNNKYGQLGDGTEMNRSTPVKIMENVLQVTPGTSNSFMAIKRDGSLWAWGSNLDGQLGDGTVADRNRPVRIMDNVAQFDISTSHKLVLKKDGTLWIWGSDEMIRFKPNDKLKLITPVKVMDNVKQINAGGSSVLVIKKDGSLYQWGVNSRQSASVRISSTTNALYDYYTIVKVMDNVAAVSQTWGSCTAIKKDGSLWQWMDMKTDAHGNVVKGEKNVNATPAKILDSVAQTENSIKDTEENTYVIKKDGSLWGWKKYKPGTQGTEGKIVPRKIMDGVASLADNQSWRIYAIKKDGSAWLLDLNTLDQDNSSKGGTSPKQVLDNVSRIIEQRTEVTMAIKKDGSLWTWGDNNVGQLGDGTTRYRQSPVKVMEGVSKVIQDAYGAAYAIMENGTLKAWGRNRYSLGNGISGNKLTPVKIMNNVKQAYAFSSHSMAVREDNSLWVWGGFANSVLLSQHYNPLYDRTVPPEKVMEDVKSVQNIQGLGYNRTIVLRLDGSLWTWGSNQYGERGVGGLNHSEMPEKVMQDVVEVCSDTQHTIILKKDGSVWAYGYNREGQLGDGTTIDKTTPVKIMKDVATICQYLNSNVYAIKKDGSLWTWGSNRSGELGDGTTINRLKPVKLMDNVSSVNQLKSGNTFVIKRDKTLWAWGKNLDGTLGDGTKKERAKPVKIMDNVVDVMQRVIGRQTIQRNSVQMDKWLTYSNLATYAVKEDGSLWAWGQNKSGELGDGTATDRLKPVKIMQDVMKINPGYSIMAVKKRDGSLWTWGDNADGLIGDGTNKSRNKPVKVMSDVSTVSMTHTHMLALKKDGNLWAWGENEDGELGDGTEYSPFPVEIVTTGK